MMICKTLILCVAFEACLASVLDGKHSEKPKMQVAVSDHGGTPLASAAGMAAPSAASAMKATARPRIKARASTAKARKLTASRRSKTRAPSATLPTWKAIEIFKWLYKKKEYRNAYTQLLGQLSPTIMVNVIEELEIGSCLGDELQLGIRRYGKLSSEHVDAINTSLMKFLNEADAWDDVDLFIRVLVYYRSEWYKDIRSSCSTYGAIRDTMEKFVEAIPASNVVSAIRKLPRTAFASVYEYFFVLPSLIGPMSPLARKAEAVSAAFACDPKEYIREIKRKGDKQYIRQCTRVLLHQFSDSQTIVKALQVASPEITKVILQEASLRVCGAEAPSNELAKMHGEYRRCIGQASRFGFSQIDNVEEFIEAMVGLPHQSLLDCLRAIYATADKGDNVSMQALIVRLVRDRENVVLELLKMPLWHRRDFRRLPLLFALAVKNNDLERVRLLYTSAMSEPQPWYGDLNKIPLAFDTLSLVSDERMFRELLLMANLESIEEHTESSDALFLGIAVDFVRVEKGIRAMLQTALIEETPTILGLVLSEHHITDSAFIWLLSELYLGEGPRFKTAHMSEVLKRLPLHLLLRFSNRARRNLNGAELLVEIAKRRSLRLMPSTRMFIKGGRDLGMSTDVRENIALWAGSQLPETARVKQELQELRASEAEKAKTAQGK